MPIDGAPRLFRIHDVSVGLSERQRELLATNLEFGPIGVATWDEDECWTVQPPA
ncbi:hypothetical protein [Tsuneonella troitsensis]|uniref:hypothetical protein n=1 Tax=Tsuneonella troitsensis TaxID=292222 RepID=UPI000AC458AF|nr:hypothetical protein [Tsuneonella troitsensis]